MADPETTVETEIDEHGRIRTLTEKGNEMYENIVRDYISRLGKQWERVDVNLQSVDGFKDNLEEIQQLQQNLDSQISEYNELCQEFIDFLARTKTVESLKEKESFEFLQSGHRILINDAQRRLKFHLENRTFFKVRCRLK